MKVFQTFKWPLIIFFVGLLSNALGLWARISHWSGADAMLTAGLVLQAFAVAYAVFLLLGSKKENTTY